MAILLIGYDLGKPARNYDDLIDTIKGLGTWWHCLDSTWLVETDKTPTQVRDTLGKIIDSDDELVVIGVRGHGGWASRGLSKDCNDWLHKRL